VQVHFTKLLVLAKYISLFSISLRFISVLVILNCIINFFVVDCIIILLFNCDSSLNLFLALTAMEFFMRGPLLGIQERLQEAPDGRKARL
jgi:hypothetical protein